VFEEVIPKRYLKEGQRSQGGCFGTSDEKIHEIFIAMKISVKVSLKVLIKISRLFTPPLDVLQV